MNQNPNLELVEIVAAMAVMSVRLRAAFTEAVHHGDLTPAGKLKLLQILDGES